MKFPVVLFFLVVSTCCFSQNTMVTIDLTTQKFIGGKSELKRERYFNLHSTYTSNELADDADYLFGKLRIGFGRSFGGPAPFRSSKTSVASISEAKSKGEQSAKHITNSSLYKDYRSSDVIITAHPSDIFQPGMNHQEIADYSVNFLKEAYPIKPSYFEVMNEPFVHAKDYVATWKETPPIVKEMSELHKVIANKIHAEIPEIMVGGYSSAWPEVDRNNFSHWNTNMKRFMDTAGESMKFFATHLYDGRNVEGEFNYRSGSNAEGILDLIETYSYKKWGLVKPHLISEYGYTAKGLQGKPYSPELDGICLTSYNNILMALLDKPDRLLKSIPFIVGKGNWFYNDKKRNPDKNPYPWVIKRRTKDGRSTFTHLKKFYELWKNVEGKRVAIKSDNPDIQVHAFVKPFKAYIAINNLHDSSKKVQLSFLKNSKTLIKNCTKQRLYNNASGIPKLELYANVSNYQDMELQAGETIILELDLLEYQFSEKLYETNHYSKTYLQEIKANTELKFILDDIKTSKKGNASLRMSIGRAHDLSKKPSVYVNGNKIEVPDNWAGYNQANRQQFFGMISIPIPIAYLVDGSNKTRIRFSDNGGFVSSVVLNVECVRP